MDFDWLDRVLSGDKGAMVECQNCNAVLAVVEGVDANGNKLPPAPVYHDCSKASGRKE